MWNVREREKEREREREREGGMPFCSAAKFSSLAHTASEMPRIMIQMRCQKLVECQGEREREEERERERESEGGRERERESACV